MKTFAVAALAAVLAAPAAFAFEPAAVPNAGPLVNAPVGSTVQIDSTGKFGDHYQNLYRVEQNGNLKFVAQYRLSDN